MCDIKKISDTSFEELARINRHQSYALQWARSGANADEFVLSPGDFHKAEKIDLANGLRLYWLDGEPFSTCFGTQKEHDLSVDAFPCAQK